MSIICHVYDKININKYIIIVQTTVNKYVISWWILKNQYTGKFDMMTFFETNSVVILISDSIKLTCDRPEVTWQIIDILNWRKGSPQETRPEWENNSLGCPHTDENNVMPCIYLFHTYKQ